MNTTARVLKLRYSDLNICIFNRNYDIQTTIIPTGNVYLEVRWQVFLQRLNMNEVAIKEDISRVSTAVFMYSTHVYLCLRGKSRIL